MPNKRASNKQRGVKTAKEGLKGSVDIKAEHAIESCETLQDLNGSESEAFTFQITASELNRYVFAPVERVIGDTHLDQRVLAGWDKQLLPPNDGLDEITLWKPFIVSMRNEWLMIDKRIEIYGKVPLVSGSRRLENVLAESPESKVRVIAIPGLTEENEIILGAPVHFGAETSSRVEFVERFETMTERLQVDEEMLTLEIKSEPFVMSTSWNFSPVLLVRCENANFDQHLIVGARSLFFPLQDILQTRGSLKGAVISVYKDGPHKSAAYRVAFLGEADS